jgi:hypothetical protein
LTALADVEPRLAALSLRAEHFFLSRSAKQVPQKPVAFGRNLSPSQKHESFSRCTCRLRKKHGDFAQGGKRTADERGSTRMEAGHDSPTRIDLRPSAFIGG